MNNPELLELAAKAAKHAGLDIEFDEASGKAFDNLSNEWDPRQHDGDALRLACALGFQVFPIARTASGAACSAVGSVVGVRLSEVTDLSLDRLSAARLAIVQAAASIGSKMP